MVCKAPRPLCYYVPKMSDGFIYQVSSAEIRTATGLDRLGFYHFKVCYLLIWFI